MSFDWIDNIESLHHQCGTLDKIIDQIMEEVKAGEEILPPLDHLFEALNKTPLDAVKVVILGQDPYPTPGHAHGLAFSVQPDVNPIPRSLQNIFRELESDLGCPQPPNGCLEPWARQGVLLLNTALSVRAGVANSHSGLWTPVTNDIIKTVNRVHKNLVFFLWGRHAQAKSIYIDNKKHLVIRSSHPSPMACGSPAPVPFLGSRPFSKANEYLEKHRIEPIDWCLAQ